MGGTINTPMYNGSVLATHDVVLVTTNYRVGAMGFLYGDDETAPGNVGLFDQVLALQWVRDNINEFGGDKNQITIFGVSAGSWSVSSLVLSPIAKGLFRRGILESGAMMFNRNTSTKESLLRAKQLAKSVNCTTDDKRWLSCLRNISANDIILSYKAGDEIEVPVDGTEFLPYHSLKAFEHGQFNTGIMSFWEGFN